MATGIKFPNIWEWISPRQSTDPAIMEALQRLATQIANLRIIEESKIPTGTKTIITSVSSTARAEYKLMPRWISFSLANDGPDSLVAWVNDDQDPARADVVGSGGTLGVDLVYPVIHSLYIKSTGTSAVRIYGIEGKSLWE